MGSMNRRRETDVMKLMMSDYEVQLTDDSKTSDFHVKFHGPKDSPYEGGSWKIHVSLPKEYPFKSPSIGFVNRIYHPNVDDMSGSVCLDVINQTWSPMFELLNVFDVFIPQLLRYPNPSDPLNGEAASLLMKDAESYNTKVRGETGESPTTTEDCSIANLTLLVDVVAEYVRSYASQHIDMGLDDEDSDVSDMSDIE